MDMFLARYKTEASSQFHQDIFEVRNDGGFQFRLSKSDVICQRQEFQYHGIFDEISGNQ